MDIFREASHVAIGGNPGVWIYRIDQIREQMVRRIDNSDGGYQIAFSSAERQHCAYVTGGQEVHLWMWSVEQDEAIWKTTLPFSVVTGLEYSPDGSTLVVSGTMFSNPECVTARGS